MLITGTLYQFVFKDKYSFNYVIAGSDSDEETTKSVGLQNLPRVIIPRNDNDILNANSYYFIIVARTSPLSA